MCRGTQVASLLGIDPAGLLKNIRDLFKVEDAVEAQPLLRQPIFYDGRWESLLGIFVCNQAVQP